MPALRQTHPANRALGGAAVLLVVALGLSLPRAAGYTRLLDENAILSQHIDELDQRMAEVDQAHLRLRAYQAQIQALTEPAGPMGPLPAPSPEFVSAPPGESDAFMDMHSSVDRIETVQAKAETFLALSKETEPDLQQIVSVLQDVAALEEATPTTWPADGDYTSGFGFRMNPVEGRMIFHSGIDIANRGGAPIVAAAAGQVKHVAFNDGYGNVVELDHGFGISTLYAHCTSVYVQEGQQVAEGEQIATVGSTGRSTGPHLHFEVHIDGHPVDPLAYLPDDGRDER